MRKETIKIMLLVLLVSAAWSCRDDELIYYPLEADTGDASSGSSTADVEYVGLYVLNEGNMGSNKATLDYLDLMTGIYHRNIYPSRNPSATMNLGDVGNDIKIYGSQLWMVINCSNKVEVADATSAVSKGHVDVPNCRYIAFDGPHAYVTSYVGDVGGTSVLGSVYRIDTTTLDVTGRVSVGYQPDELTVRSGKLYVANSGGYNALEGKGYDNTISVIDLATFTLDDRITVAPNLFRLRTDHKGRLWAATRGDYGDYPSRLYVIEEHQKSHRMVVTDSVDVPVTDFAFFGDSIYFYGIEDVDGKKQRNYGIIHAETREVLTRMAIDIAADDPIRTAYALMVHPQNGDLYVFDATNYVSSGKLFCFDRHGRFKWSTYTGDIPGHGAFLTRPRDKGT